MESGVLLQRSLSSKNLRLHFFLLILSKSTTSLLNCFVYVFLITQLNLQSSISIQLCYSVMDIKELKFLDICTTTTKPNCGQGALTETGVIPPRGHSHTSRITCTPETNSTSHLNPAPVTTLRKGKYERPRLCKKSLFFYTLLKTLFRTLTKTKHFACQHVAKT